VLKGPQAHGGDPDRGDRATLIAGWFDLPSATGSRCSARFRRACRLSLSRGSARRDIVPILAGGVAVAIVAFADTSVLSRTYAARTGTRVDPNQEMVGLGAANLAAGFFQGFPISSSSSRTPVAEAAGAKTQMTGVIGALVVAW
jgi:MFS superfamily sulfate permease-like transporter